MAGYDIGIRIVSYKSIADAVRILRRYTRRSVSEIKSSIDRGGFVFSGDQCRDDDLDNVIECCRELTDASVKVQLYQDDRPIPLQFLLNLRESSRETALELEAEAELEDADPEALEAFRFLWMAEKDDWVVIRKDCDYTVFNPEKQTALLIEDEDLNNQAAAMMIMHGCRVVSSPQEAGEKCPTEEGRRQ